MHADEKGKGRGTHLANDLAQQEEVQLAEDKQNRSQDVIPHRAHFIQHPEHDVGHEQQVDDRRAAGGMETNKQNGRVSCASFIIHHEWNGAVSRSRRSGKSEKWTHTAGQMLVSTKSEMLLRSTSGFEGPNTLVNEKPTSRAMYVVAAKNASTKKPNGCRVVCQISLALALSRAGARTEPGRSKASKHSPIAR